MRFRQPQHARTHTHTHTQHTHARSTHARTEHTHARTHRARTEHTVRTYARTHTHTHTHTHARTQHARTQRTQHARMYTYTRIERGREREHVKMTRKMKHRPLPNESIKEQSRFVYDGLRVPEVYNVMRFSQLTATHVHKKQVKVTRKTKHRLLPKRRMKEERKKVVFV